jgi:hypothetical protein
MYSRVALVLAVALPLGACGPKAHDVSATFALSPSVPAGNVEVVLNNASDALSVAINDQLVVDRKLSRKATIGGVPAGPARVHVAIGGGCETGATFDRDIEVIPGATTTITLPGPEISTGCAIASGLYYVGLNIGYVAMVAAVYVGVASARRGK